MSFSGLSTVSVCEIQDTRPEARTLREGLREEKGGSEQGEEEIGREEGREGRGRERERVGGSIYEVYVQVHGCPIR